MATIKTHPPKQGNQSWFADSKNVLLASTLFIFALGYVFYQPDYVSAHVDDLFLFQWAAEFAQTGRHTNSQLAQYLPDGWTELFTHTRFHFILSGWFFRAFGISSDTFIIFGFLCYASFTFAFLCLCYNNSFSLASIFAPYLFLFGFAVAGFRFEITGAIFWIVGIACLRSVHAPDAGQKLTLIVEFLAKLSLAFAPLAAPALLGWSLGVFAVTDGYRIVQNRRKLPGIFLINSAVLIIVVMLFSVSIDFNFSEFYHQFSTIAALVSSGIASGNLKIEHLLKGLGFLAIAYAVRSKNREAATLIAMIGAGQVFAAILHDKGLIRNLATFMVILLTAQVIHEGKYKPFAWTLAIVASVAMSFNFVSFRIFSKVAQNSPAPIVADYQADRNSGKTVMIDETMALHFGDQKNTGTIAWTWSLKIPKNRPQSLSDLHAGEVWYVSKFTLYKYFSGSHPMAQAIWPRMTYETTPQLGCPMGG